MTEATKRACLIYVSATSGRAPAARKRLEAEGYGVCEFLVESDTAIAVAAHDFSALPPALKECIESSDLSVFLLPPDAKSDGCIPAGSSLSSELGKRFIGVVDGGRDVLPESFEQDAAGIVHDCDESLTQAIRGDPSFKNPDGTVRERNIKHLKCQ